MNAPVRIPTKEALLAWVEEVAMRDGLDPRRTLALGKFAGFADAAFESWAKNETLMFLSRSSERQVRKMLREFEDAGYFRNTGRTHRIEGSTRSVPLYVWAGFLDDFRAAAIPARRAPIEPHGGTGDEGMGAQGVPPHNEPREPSSEGEGARAREALFAELKAATPKRILAVSDQLAARDALDGLAAAGVDVGVLPGCMRRWAVDPLFTGRKVPVSLERWLASGMWEGSLPEASPAAVGAAAEGEPEHPLLGVVLDAVRPFVGEGEMGSYLRPARIREADGAAWLVALTGVARAWIERTCWPRLAEAWAAAGDAEARPLRLISKTEFEALLRQGEA